MKNVPEVTNVISDVTNKLLAGEIDVKTAEAVANLAGKTVKANAGQIDYYELKARAPQTPNLPFWEK